ncbi:MAG: hypothetical protein HC896_02515 [Bacteroidales bacterium]|nr:hypothetical protein [Bacteroidales bacterium]
MAGYGEAHYNQPLNADVRQNGKLDVHRLVMLLGYNFTSKTQFVSEIEFEHVSEVYVEQAFLQHRVNEFVNLRAGLLLVPMGIVNEYHEPTTFNGVERPHIDNVIAPTTWREIGAGVQGNVLGVSIKYQAYVMNGFTGYTEKDKEMVATLSGSNGLRGGRQKGAESHVVNPNFTGKVEYYGINGLNLGVSGYVGKTQSILYKSGIDKNDDAAMAKADSSVVGVSMLGIDGRYSNSGLQLRGQFYFTNLSNTLQYNQFTGSDLGSAMVGYYAEAGYDVLKPLGISQMGLVPFVRLEAFNTQQSVENGITANQANSKSIVTTGLTCKLAKGAVLKADMQFVKSEADDKYAKTFNAGFGVMF